MSTSPWPNEAGFDNDWEQHTPIALTVKGEIPRYAAGVLYRTGPLGYKIPTDKGTTWSANHWFDGLSSMHRFQIDVADDGTTQVTYNSRRTADEYLEMVKKTGTLDAISFGAKRDPCKSVFQKIMTMYTAQRSNKNVGVTVSINMPGGGYIKGAEKPLVNGHSNSTGVETLHAKTDNKMLKKLDPETLEPIGFAVQQSLHPELDGPLAASHAKTDPETGDLFNFNLKAGYKSVYKVFRTSAATGETEILARINAKPAYLHSLFLTKNYVVLCVWNSHITWAGLSVLYNQNLVDSMAPFDPSKPAMWYVVDRNGKGVVATYSSDAFFCFHAVNAWEEPSSTAPGKTDILCEMSQYDNLDIIKRFYYDHVISSGEANNNSKKPFQKGPSCLPNQSRYRLYSVDSGTSPTKPLKAERVFLADKAKSMELPTINPAYLMKPHRYTYGACDRLKSSFIDGLVKFDSVKQESIFWECEGHTPGEPIFVADPDGKAEDDGIILSVVLDGFAEKSYLLCLDARDFSEKGRAEMPGPMAFGFHGAHKAMGRIYGGDI